MVEVIKKIANAGKIYSIGGGSTPVEEVEHKVVTQEEFDVIPQEEKVKNVYMIKGEAEPTPTPISINDNIMALTGGRSPVQSNNSLYIIPNKTVLKRGTLESTNINRILSGAIVGDYLFTLDSYAGNNTVIKKINLSTGETEEITITNFSPSNLTIIVGEGDYLYFIRTSSSIEDVIRYNLNTQERKVLNNTLQLDNVAFIKNGVLYNHETDVLVGYDVNDNFEIVDRISFPNGIPMLSGNDIYAVIGENSGLQIIQKVYTFNS